MKCMHIYALKTTMKKQFSLHCRFEFHYGNTKEYLRHNLQKYCLNVFKYFKDEAIKFPPNHPQRSYVKKTTEATGFLKGPSLGYVRAPSSTAGSSAAAQNSQSVTSPPEIPASSTAARIPVPDKRSPPATWKMHPHYCGRLRQVCDSTKNPIILQSRSSYQPMTSCWQFFVKSHISRAVARS